MKGIGDGSVGLCGIDPNYKDWEQLREFCKEFGLNGIKLHTDGAKFSLLNNENQERLDEIFNKAGELQFPVLIHSSFSSEDEARVLIKVAASNKNTKFIFAHMLGKNWRLMSQAIPNIYVDISGAVIMLRKSANEVVNSGENWH